MLKIDDLDICYGDNCAVTDFGLDMKHGQITSIVGESGSGKSTVVRAILGLLPTNGYISKGKICFNETDLAQLTKEQFRAIRSKDIAMIFQDSGATLNPIRKIGSQYIEYIRANSNMTKKEAHDVAYKMLCKTNLNDVENVLASYPFQLSGGMRQRVGIAMAMTFKPQLLLADEPTSALDVTTQTQIIKEMMIQRNENNTAIILVTHNLSVAAYMSDYIIVLKDGRIMEEGTRNQVINHPTSDYTKLLLKSVPRLNKDITEG